jgi:hypothetical protein
VGHYLRTDAEGRLHFTTSSVEDWYGITTLGRAQEVLTSRCDWLPWDELSDDPYERAMRRPKRGGWRLGGIATEYRSIASSEVCSRCGDRRSLCGGESNPHE